MIREGELGVMEDDVGIDDILLEEVIIMECFKEELVLGMSFERRVRFF